MKIKMAYKDNKWYDNKWYNNNDTIIKIAIYLI